jgi:hypothetical protein
MVWSGVLVGPELKLNSPDVAVRIFYVEFLQPRFHAEGEAMTAMLPRNIVVILVSVVVELVGSIARQRPAVG